MRYVILVFLFVSVASLGEQSTSMGSEIIALDSYPAEIQTIYDISTTNVTLSPISGAMTRLKRSAEKSLHHSKKKKRRKAKRRKIKRYLQRQIRKAEKKMALLQLKALADMNSEERTRQSREDETLASHEATQEKQNELLSSVDDLPKRSTTVEISVKDPGLCKVDGVPMCKHGGECMSRDEGGAPVFFCACQPAWGGDFCHERRDPCSAGLPDCGSMFRCRRDEHNGMAGFTCDCHKRLGWTRRSESDPRCIRITNCSEGNPCQHGGTCRQEEGGFVCVCTAHSSGDLCEHPVSVGASAEVAAPAVTKIETLLKSDRPVETIHLPRSAGDVPLAPRAAGDPQADPPTDLRTVAQGASYSSIVSANYAVPPPRSDADSWAGGGGAWAGDLSQPVPGENFQGIDPRRVSSRYGSVVSAKYGVPPVENDYSSYLKRRAAETPAVGYWPGYGYYGNMAAPAAAAPQMGAVPVPYSGTPWAGYAPAAVAASSRRRRSHDHRQTSRRRRKQEKFLDRLLQDVEPQIRRTARDSVIELPHR